MRNLELKLGHILYHLDEHRRELKAILSGDSSRLFMSFFRDYLMKLFEGYIEVFGTDVPRDYLLNHLVSGFAETARWWLTEKNDYSPEETAGFYMRLTEK